MTIPITTLLARYWYHITFVFSVSLASLNSQASEPDMAAVYDAIAVLLPASVNPSGDGAAWSQSSVGPHLKTLAGAGDIVEAHARAESGNLAVLDRPYAQLLADIIVSFQKNWPDYAYYSVMEFSDHCVSCHARLPVENQRWFGPHLIKRMDTNALSDDKKALVYIALRQIRPALRLLEDHLLAPESSPQSSINAGLGLRYLRIGLSQAINAEGLLSFIDSYLLRSDLTTEQRSRWQRWRTSLSRLGGSLAGTPNPARALKIFENVGARWTGGNDRVRAVDDLIAANMLRRYVQANSELSAQALAAHYFQLATIALRTREPQPPVPEMEVLLTAAIKTAPGSPVAARAYEMLMQFGAIGGERLSKQHATQHVMDMRELGILAGHAP